MEVEHVAETAISEGGAEDGDVVAVGPIADAFFVVDFFAQAVDHTGRGPVYFAF